MCLAIPGQVVDVGSDRFDLATVEVGGARRQVSLGLFEAGEVRPGDWVLIHVGFALSKIDEQEAAETLRMLEGLGKAYTDELEALGRSAID